MLDDIIEAARAAAIELYEKAGLEAQQTVIVGCSTSEIAGHNIGTFSNSEIGSVVFEAVHRVFSRHGVNMAVQSCEHLNRAIIVERDTFDCRDIVNVVPTPKAGGAFAAAAYAAFVNPVAIEAIQADAGLDIGGTLIGMHLKRVAVPLRLETKHIGKAAVIAARTRPPLIGGTRAIYDETLM
jgi:uncharacterized protein (TIGR01440 family)